MIYKSDGTAWYIFEGYYRMGQKTGLGREISNDGQVYIGEYQFSMKNGNGV